MPGRVRAGRVGSEASKEPCVWGINAVREMLVAAPTAIEALYVLRSRESAVSEIAISARRAGLDLRECDSERMNTLSHGENHQGVIARLAPFRYADLNEIIRARPKLVVALDCMQDPRNLGAILRTAEAVAAGGMLLPKDRSAGVTPGAVRTAAGHVYRVPVARVTNLARAVDLLRTAGWWALGLVPRAERSLYEVDLPDRLVLVGGGEGKGIRPLVARACDALVSLPMAEGVNSLNAAVALGVALYEVRRRGQGGGAR